MSKPEIVERATADCQSPPTGSFGAIATVLLGAIVLLTGLATRAIRRKP